MTTTHPVTQLSPGQFLPSWMARTASEPSSWGEYLKQYEKNRCQPCTLAVPRTKAAQDSRHNREFDIILQRYRDLTKEEHFRRRSEEKRQAHMEAAMKKTNARGHGYDIIDNTGELPPSSVRKVVAKRRNVNASRADYNILSACNGSSSASSQMKRISLRTQKDTRQFNIVSNKYTSNHKERFEADMKAEKFRLAEQYRRERNYDPVRVRYYDSAREKEFQRKLDEEKSEINLGQLQKLPPSYKVCEGNVFNIVNGKVIQEEQHKRYEERMSRRRNLAKQNQQVLKDQRLRGCKKEDLGQQRRYNRISTKRFTQERERGFDIISQVDLKPMKPHKYFPKPKLSVWEAMNKKVNAQAKTGTG
ncbi:hypothetical protein AAMO2058_001074000 [Amorphochlora amoebiformis]